MQASATSLEGLVILEPDVFHDDRGFVVESWNRRVFEEATGVDVDFVQDTVSGSKRGVLRGLHYQVAPDAQGKLVRTVLGSIFDVTVDLRRSSPTFGEWFGVELSEMNQRQLWIPAGFAHGFLTTSDWAEVHYKTTGYYVRSSERGLMWDDPDIGIEWPLQAAPVLSDKDAGAPSIREIEVFA
jgi:dTDP-4-dehydrorhamnose 3,5-epimerase